MTDYVAALEGGGTKTHGAFADKAGNVHWITADAGCNPQDGPGWRDVLTRVMQQFPPVVQATLGLPGYGEIAGLDRAMQAHLAAFFGLTTPPNNMTLLNDVALAYHGAFPDSGGTLVLAGTGSMAMAQGTGRLIRVGGWGDAFGDEGSAFWIGRTALAMASQMIDGRLTDTGFAQRLQSKLGIAAEAGPFGLTNWVVGQPNPRPKIALISLYVNELSDQADVTARVILSQAADQLATLAIAAAQQAGLPLPLRWTHAGSVFCSDHLLAGVTTRLGIAPVAPQFDAIGGGLWLAARAAGWDVDAQWAARITGGIGQKETAGGA